jgi:hypothetical protein
LISSTTVSVYLGADLTILSTKVMFSLHGKGVWSVEKKLNESGVEKSQNPAMNKTR